MVAIMWEALLGLFLDIFISCMQGEYSVYVDVWF